MAGDDKKKEMKKEADALQKLLKEAGKKIDRLMKLGSGDTLFMSMIKMLDMAAKEQNTQVKLMLKQLK